MPIPWAQAEADSVGFTNGELLWAASGLGDMRGDTGVTCQLR